MLRNEVAEVRERRLGGRVGWLAAIWFHCEIWQEQADRVNGAHYCFESIQVAPLSR
jgi:hypothetical protein